MRNGSEDKGEKGIEDDMISVTMNEYGVSKEVKSCFELETSEI